MASAVEDNSLGGERAVEDSFMWTRTAGDTRRMAQYYYEDLAVGDGFHASEYTVEAAEIKEFAEKYDPHPFHLDEEAAADSFFGELVASGLHTLSVTFKLLHEGPFDEIAVMGGRGLDSVRFRRPVTPGETLSSETVVVKRRLPDESRSKGNVDLVTQVTNDEGEEVLSFIALAMVERRDPDAT